MRSVFRRDIHCALWITAKLPVWCTRIQLGDGGGSGLDDGERVGSPLRGYSHGPVKQTGKIIFTQSWPCRMGNPTDGWAGILKWRLCPRSVGMFGEGCLRFLLHWVGYSCPETKITRIRAPKERARKEEKKRMSEQQIDQQNALDQLSINTLRFLAVDAVEKAKSGHPGAPLGCAPIAYLLYHKLMLLRSVRSEVDQPGSFCAVERTRLGSSVRCSAPPRRLRSPDLTAGAIPPVGIAHSGTSGSMARPRVSRLLTTRSSRTRICHGRWDCDC